MASQGFLLHAVVRCAAVVCLSMASAPAFAIVWVSVGDPNNAADTTGAPNPAGSVAASFRIMRYEFTNQQYADFLNSVAVTDTYSLYNPSMGTNARGGITRSGAPGGYAYAVKANMGDKPVNYVSWWDAARVANWLVNGAAGGSSTETGAYTLSGGTTGIAPAVNADATYFLPTENQWYKAAFYKGGGQSAGYWDYATQSDTAPTGVTADAGGAGSAGDTGNFANFDFNADWNTLNGNLTTVATNGGPSAYDAFDLDGNVREWNDLNGAASSSRGIRGGSWDYPVASLSSSNRLLNPPDFESHAIGFRLASVAIVPEPSTWAIAAGGLACAAGGAFRRRTRA